MRRFLELRGEDFPEPPERAVKPRRRVASLRRPVSRRRLARSSPCGVVVFLGHLARARPLADDREPRARRGLRAAARPGPRRRAPACSRQLDGCDARCRARPSRANARRLRRAGRREDPRLRLVDRLRARRRHRADPRGLDDRRPPAARGAVRRACSAAGACWPGARLPCCRLSAPIDAAGLVLTRDPVAATSARPAVSQSLPHARSSRHPRPRRRRPAGRRRPAAAQSVVSRRAHGTLYTDRSDRPLPDRRQWLFSSTTTRQRAASSSASADRRLEAGHRPERLERRRRLRRVLRRRRRLVPQGLQAPERRQAALVGRALRVGQLPRRRSGSTASRSASTAAPTCPSRSRLPAGAQPRRRQPPGHPRRQPPHSRPTSRPSGLSIDGHADGGWWNYGGLLREVYLRRVDGVDFDTVQVRPTLPCATCAATVRLPRRRCATTARRPAGQRHGALRRAARRPRHASTIGARRGARRFTGTIARRPTRACGRRRRPYLYDASLAVRSGGDGCSATR